MYADHIVLMAELNKNQRIVYEFGRACDRMSLKIGVDKSKTLVARKVQRGSIEKVKGVGRD